MDAQISPPATFFECQNLPDQSQHPPYILPFHVVGFAPVSIDLDWNNTLEPKKKRPKEQEFLEDHSQISSVDFLQPRSVSTGLGLSLDNGRLASSGDSPLFALIGDDIDHELQRQETEIDRYIRVQGDRLRQSILEKVQANQLKTISCVEEKVLRKIREKEAEVEDIHRKNMVLELQLEQLVVEASAWQQRATYNENVFNTLKFNLHQIYAQSRDSKEGCGDSEVDDTTSFCNGCVHDFHLSRDGNEMKELMICRVCRVNQVCMLLLPCNHLCLCKECESQLTICPLCQSSKNAVMEVYM